METGIFRGYGMKPRNFSGLRNKNLIFSGMFRHYRVPEISGLHSVNRKKFCVLLCKPENSGFHFIHKFSRIPLYETNFLIIPFPKWNFYSYFLPLYPNPLHIINSLKVKNSKVKVSKWEGKMRVQNESAKWECKMSNGFSIYKSILFFFFYNW